MKKTQAAAIIGLLCTFTFQSRAKAWGDLGHEVVGSVAEQMIKPETKAFVRGVLGVEPMVAAATWPDHVRDDDRFGHNENDPAKKDHDDHDFAPFHILEIPTGSTFENNPMKTAKNAYGAIIHSSEILKNASASREEKMIALRYLIHVMGDIHQPLHVGNGYDRGANTCQIVWKDGQRPDAPMNLHSFYDTTIVTFIGRSYADIEKKIPPAIFSNQFAQGLNRRYPQLFTTENKATLQKIDVPAWLMEAQSIRETMYPDDAAAMANVPKGEEYKNRPYCTWFVNQKTDKVPANTIDKTKIPTLDAAYATKFSAVIENQLIKAGIRLAVILDDIASNQAQGTASIDDARQEQILKSVQDALRNK